MRIMRKSSLLFAGYVGAEMAFYAWRAAKTREVEGYRPLFRDCPQPFHKDRRRDVVEAILRREFATPERGRQWLEGWLCGTSLDKVSRADVSKFLAWAYYNKDVSPSADNNLTTDEQIEIDNDIRRLETLGKVRFRQGEEEYTATTPMLRPNLDDHASFVRHKPLAFYLLSEIVHKAIVPIFMRSLSFERRAVTVCADDVSPSYTLRYWFRAGSDVTPIVFAHGVGIGLVPYFTMLREMVECMESVEVGGGPSPLFVLDMAHVNALALPSSGNAFWGPTPHQITQSIVRMLESAACKDEIAPSSRVKLVGHSYGTWPVLWTMRARPDLVSSAILIDPVAFVTHRAGLAQNFVYGPGSTEGRAERSLYRFALEELVNRDASIVANFLRHFWWYEGVFDIDHVLAALTQAAGPADASVLLTFLLSEDDRYLDAAIAYRDVSEKSRVVADVWKRTAHGDFLFDHEKRSGVVRHVILGGGPCGYS